MTENRTHQAGQCKIRSPLSAASAVDTVYNTDLFKRAEPSKKFNSSLTNTVFTLLKLPHMTFFLSVRPVAETHLHVTFPTWKQ